MAVGDDGNICRRRMLLIDCWRGYEDMSYVAGIGIDDGIANGVAYRMRCADRGWVTDGDNR